MIGIAGRFARALHVALLLVVLVAAVALVANERAQYGAGIWPWHRTTSAEAYRIGTRGRYPFVTQRELVFESRPMSPVDGVTFGSPPRSDGIAAAFVADGSLEGSSKIVVFLGATRLSNQAIAHEYGHALLWDYLDRRVPGNTELNVGYAFHALSDYTPDGTVDGQLTKDRPEFGPLLGEYRSNRMAFGEYASQSFGEWFAEASNYYLYGKPVPPKTSAFLRAAEMLK